MLLKIKATIKRINAPLKTGENTYQYPKSRIAGEPVTAIKAVAPPGGCKVLVICINTIAEATATAEADAKAQAQAKAEVEAVPRWKWQPAVEP